MAMPQRDDTIEECWSKYIKKENLSSCLLEAVEIALKETQREANA